MKVVIVGGVAGGATAAARIRRLAEKARIIIFERSGYISYANCGLPYYIGDIITDKEELTLQTPEKFWQRFRIEARVRHEVLAVNRDRKTVTVRNLQTGEIFEESYDKLLLAPGARPVVPLVPGVDNDRIFTLRQVEDTFKIKEYVTEQRPQSAVIVGGGYIGLEMAENLAARGVKVTIVQRGVQLMNTLDYDMATFVQAHLREKGVQVLLGEEAVAFTEEEGTLQVHLKNHGPLSTAMVVLAVGVTPETGLASKAGLKLGEKGHILVNERLETSQPDIYAVGDAVLVEHYVTGRPVAMALAGPANKQGRIAADNICGGESRYKGTIGSSIIRIFDLTVASTGLNESGARAAGINYERVVLSPAAHAGYFPGARIMTMKIVFEKETLRLLGAQIVGYEGVDKRIDVLATAIHAGMAADELKELELAYAPPYSSARDPVNMAGFIIDNLQQGLIRQFHWDEVATLPRDGRVTLLDTRTGSEYARGHVDGFINIPVDELRERLGELDQNKPVYVMCQSGLRSYIACRLLAQNGYNCYNFSGGYRFYERINTEKKSSAYAFPCGMDK